MRKILRLIKNDNRPQCCIDHDKYFSTCDTCELESNTLEVKTCIRIVVRNVEVFHYIQK